MLHQVHLANLLRDSANPLTTTGIGAAVARAFTASGCTKLALLDQNEKGLESTLASLNKSQETSIKLYKCDVSSPPSISEAFSQIRSDFGRLDYAVNCAGIGTNNKPSTDCAIEEFDRIQAVNLRGVWLCAREELAIMKEQSLVQDAYPDSGIPPTRSQRGAIVHISSGLGIVAQPASPAYCAAKAGLLSLTRADALDYAQYGIRVNAVLPGLVDTPMIDSGPGLRDMVIHIVENTPAVPMRRIAQADEIADVAVFLSSHKASYVQGASWVCDGGYTAQ